MLCLHHTDPDGWCSAAIVKKFYASEDIRFHGITYGYPLPLDKIKLNEDVFIVDYSLTPTQWQQLLAITPNVYWFDHHKTAIEDERNPHHLKGIRRDGIAACEILWEYFYPQEDMPRSVTLTGDWDVWKFDHEPQTSWFFHGIQNTEGGNQPDSELWEKLLHEDAITPNRIAEICITGETIKSYQDRKNKSLVKHRSNIIWFEGLRVCAVNSQVYGSPVFESVNPDLYDGLAVYSWNGNFWKISLYTTHDHIDMSTIAVRYGGGGHRAACGFEMSRLPFDFTKTVNYDEENNAIVPSSTIGSRIREWALYRWRRRWIRKN